MARPCSPFRNVDVVVAGNLLARRNVASCREIRGVAFVQHIGIGVTAVINVAIGRAQENSLAVRVVAVVGSLAKFFPQRRCRRDFAHNVDSVNTLPRQEGPSGKESQAFDCGRLNLDIAHGSNNSDSTPRRQIRR